MSEMTLPKMTFEVIQWLQNITHNWQIFASEMNGWNEKFCLDTKKVTCKYFFKTCLKNFKEMQKNWHPSTSSCPIWVWCNTTNFCLSAYLCWNFFATKQKRGRNQKESFKKIKKSSPHAKVRYTRGPFNNNLRTTGCLFINPFNLVKDILGSVLWAPC